MTSKNSDSKIGVESLISHLYRSAPAVAPEHYRLWALEQISQVIDFDAAFWGTGNWESNQFHYVSQIGLDVHYGERLVETIEINPIKEGVLSNLGSVVDMSDVYPDATFYQSELYSRLFQPYGIKRILASGHEDKVSGLYTLLSLYRFDKEHVFTPDERQLQQRLIYHLVSAASHAFFLHLLFQHPQDRDGTFAAICDHKGCFHEAQPKFLSLIKEHFPDRESMSLPFDIPPPGESLELNNLVIGSKPLGDLTIVYIRPAGRLDILTEREQQIVALIVKGYSFKEAAKSLQLAPSTVSNHLYKVYDKLGISSRGELARLMEEQ